MLIPQQNLQNNNYFSTIANDKKVYRPTFGEYNGIDKIKNNKNLISETVMNFSGLLRDCDYFWEDFTNYLKDKHPNGVRIQSGTGSNGSEAYSLIMKLIDKYGIEDSKKYFPIKVTDISRKSIKSINSHKLNISDRELERMKLCLVNHKVDDFFTMIGEGKPQEKKSLLVGDDYMVKEVLHSNIQAGVADIFKEIKNPDNISEPLVLLLRNCWYLLKKDSRENLARELYKNLQPGSSVVIGSVDLALIPETLIKQGFVRINKFIFEKPLLNRVL